MAVAEELKARQREILEQRDAALAELEKLQAALSADGSEPRELTEEEEKRSKELLKTIDRADEELRALAKRRKELRKQEKRQALIEKARREVRSGKTEVEVIDEPPVYGKGSPYSYFADLVRFSGGPQWPDHAGAAERLRTWSHQVEREIHRKPTSKQSKLALKQLREVYRPLRPEQAQMALKTIRERGSVALEDKPTELRATGITTGGGASATAAAGGAAFVTPIFFVSDYAPFREYGRAFAEATNKQPLPDYGMEVYLPAVLSPAEVATQTEGNQVAERVPTAGYLSGSLQTPAGEVIVSQQLLDRAGPNFSFDRLIFDQLMRDYAPKVDRYVLSRALQEAQSQEWSGNAGTFVLFAKEAAGGFYGQVSKAKAAIRTKEGTVLNPTHLFLRPERWEFIAATFDGMGRPLVVPDYGGPWNAAAGGSDTGDVGIEGATGYRFNGLPAFTDANIPNYGTTNTDQAIVADMSEVWLFEGQVVPRVIPQTYAQNLQVLLQIYAYVTCIVRFPSAVVAIHGTGMAPIEYTH